MKKIFLSILGFVLIASAMGQNVFTVTKTTDPDPYIHPFNNDDNLCDPEMYGTLQWAINKVNNSASNSIIEFNIPGTGVRQITLNHYLPQVYSPQYEVVLDGTSQPGYDGTPLIKVDGSSYINNCFDIYKSRVTIRGFHISNFTENAIKLQLSSYSGVTGNTITNIQNTAKTQIASGIFIGGSNQVTVTGNYIGYDPAQLENNGIKHYGVFIDKSSNCQVGTSIDTTANIISNCMFGIFVHNGIQNALSGNSIFDNSKKAIYLGSGANEDIAAPVITSYTGVLTGTSVPNAQIEIFGSTGTENAEQYLATTTADASGNWSLPVSTNYHNLTATTIDGLGNTSALSNAIINPLLSTELQDWFQDADSIEFDRFLYAKPLPGALQYEFHVQQSDFGVNETLVKDVPYFSLNELNADRYYGMDYHIKVRAMYAEDACGWGNTTVLIAEDHMSHMYGRIIVSFTDSVSGSSLLFGTQNGHVRNNEIPGFNDISESSGITDISFPYPVILRNLGRNPLSCVEFRFAKTFSADSLVSYWNTIEFVESAELVSNSELAVLPDDYIPSQDLNSDQLSDVWHLTRISAPEAWGIVSFEANDVIIAVPDNVFNLDHEELIDNVYVNMGEIPDGILEDENENGYIDGYDLLQHYNGSYNSLKELFANQPVDDIFDGVDDDDNDAVDDICGWDVTDWDNNVNFTQLEGSHISHGTITSCLAGGTTNNSNGICALAGNVRVIPVKMSTDEDVYHHENNFNMLKVIEYLLSLNEKPDVISMSYSSPSSSSAELAAYEQCENFGIVCIASTGNDGHNLTSTGETRYPAFYPNVVAVGATTYGNTRASFSNHGALSDTYVLAPGEDVFCSDAGDYSHNNEFTTESGTSLSTPITSSLAGLLFKYNPDLSPEAIRQAIECGCTNNPNQISGYNPGEDGSGQINAYQSLLCLQSASPVANISYEEEYHCAGHMYSFQGHSESSVDGLSYSWSVSGGNFQIVGSSNNEQLDIYFDDNGVYTISCTITNSAGSDTHEITIDVQNPYVEILNGDSFNMCTGNQTDIYLQLHGNPPFELTYTYTGSTSQTVVLSEPLESISLNTSGFDTGETVSFNITGFSDNDCVGLTDNCNIAMVLCNVCNEKYNNIMHFNPLNGYALSGGGESRGIYFNGGSASETENPIPGVMENDNGVYEGVASICDIDGYPILSSNGKYIYSTSTACGNMQLNTTALREDVSSCQGVLILPDRTTEDQYYVLLMPEENSESSFDWLKVIFSSSSPCGEIVDPAGSVFSSSAYPVSEKMTACKIPGENAYWLLTRSSAGNTYYVFRVGSSVEFSHQFSIGTSSNTNLGAMKLSNDGKFLAVALHGQNKVELYRFDPENGTIEEEIEVMDFMRPFSLEFSKENHYLYITQDFSGTERLYRYSIDLLLSNIVYQEYIADAFNSGVRLGPDNRMYFATMGNDNNVYSSVIDNPDEAALNIIPNVYETHHIFSYPQRVPVSNLSFSLEHEYENCLSNINISELYGDGPFSYEWSTGAGSDHLEDIDPGTYSVTVTSAYGCTASDEITVDYTTISFSDVYVHFPCMPESDGEITVDMAGGSSPYTYHWENESGTTIGTSASLTGLSEGTYYLTVSDSDNCTLTLEQSIYPSAPPEMEFSDITGTCGEENGSATVIVTNGPGTYTYLWDNGETTATATQLSTGTHNVTVTDDNGCSTAESVGIEDGTPSSVFKIFCDCMAAGYEPLQFLIMDYHAEYTYEWDFGDGSTATGYDPQHLYDYYGYYCVTLTASNGGCTTSTSETIFINPNECACQNTFPYGSNDYPYGTIIQSGASETWASEKYVDQDVVVKSGGRLRIKGTSIHFGPRGRIIVEPEGFLEVNNAILTNLSESGCTNMWTGIEVQGAYAHNGEVILTDSEIRNAHIGVYIGKRNMDVICDGSALTIHGQSFGYLIAKGTEFVNCGTGIFDALKNFPPALSREVNACTFTSDILPDPGYDISHPVAYIPDNATGISPRIPWAYRANPLQRGACGIYAVNAKTYVCKQNRYENIDNGILLYLTNLKEDNSQYYNCRYGIEALPFYTGTGYNGIINSSFNLHPGPGFNTEGAAIFAKGSFGDKIRKNTFGNDNPGTEQSYNETGIFMYNASGYTILDNTFTLVETGIQAKNSAEGGGFIGISGDATNTYGNRFTRCYRNIYTKGDNSALKLRCNLCDNPAPPLYDVNFLNRGDLATQGILPYPASFLPPERRPAGNQFNQYVGPHDYTYHEIQSISQPYVYVHHNEFLGAEPWKIMPKAVWNTAVGNPSVNLLEYSNAVYQAEESCKPVVESDPYRYGIVVQNMESALQRKDSLTAILDKGNTTYLLDMINRHHSGDGLIGILEMNSPLSDTVLLSLMLHDSVTNEEFYRVMKINTPVSKANEAAFYARTAQLKPDEQQMMWQIQTFNEDCITETFLSREYEMYHVLARQIYSELIRALIDKEDEKELESFLRKEEDNLSRELLVGMYLDKNDERSSREILDRYQPVTVQDSMWKAYVNIFVTNLESGQEKYYLDRGNKRFVNMLADHCEYGRATVYAQNLLSMLYGYEYDICETDTRSAFTGQPDSEKNKLAVSVGNAFPNPATQKLFVPYKCPVDVPVSVEVCDLSGRFIEKRDLTSGNSVLELNVDRYVPGMYQVKFIFDNAPVQTVKFVKQ